MLIVIFAALAIALLVVYLASRRYKLRAAPFIVSNIVGFVVFAIFSNLSFGLLMDSGFIFTDLSSILGGGLGWTAVVVASVMKLRPVTNPMAWQEFPADHSEVVNYSAARAIWTLIGQGLAAMAMAILSALIIDFMVFFMYGLMGFQITELPIIIARFMYVLVCTIGSYFAFDLLLRRKSNSIRQALYPQLAMSTQHTGQGTVFQEDKPKRKVWLWWLGGCSVLICAGLGIAAFFLFSPAEESYPLDGRVSIPSTIKKGDNFDIVITLTNSKANPIFINHVVLHSLFEAPSLLDGATITTVEPAMLSEPLSGSTNELQFSYFRDIKPGETQTVIFHMQAVNTGTYYTNVAVYGPHATLPEPAFSVDFYFATAETEITP